MGHAKNKNALSASHKKLFCLRTDLKGCVSLPASVANMRPSQSPELHLKERFLHRSFSSAAIKGLVYIEIQIQSLFSHPHDFSSKVKHKRYCNGYSLSCSCNEVFKNQEGLKL